MVRPESITVKRVSTAADTRWKRTSRVVLVTYRLSDGPGTAL
jgi:hypothetical protein